MSDVKSHYDQFLAPLYSWVAGDFEKLVETERAYLAKVLKACKPGAKALDLGAGHGVHSAALLQLGYQVEAVDTSTAILETLKARKGHAAIRTVAKDMRTYRPLAPVETCVCMGDTLAHLASYDEVANFATHVHSILRPGAQFVMSFRDFTKDLKNTGRGVLVREEENRIFDCFMFFGTTHIEVIDAVHENTSQGWTLRTSSYRKLRLTAEEVIKTFKANGFSLVAQENSDNFVRICLRS
jgi:2-polyprenyl-3-methyl-5-hydroxy-6-metoxy-1,4-benzoquinol methylase